jgi:predicted outer membrane repeat protein
MTSTLTSAAFSSNRATGGGGAIYYEVTAPLTNGATLDKNTAGYGPNTASGNYY